MADHRPVPPRGPLGVPDPNNQPAPPVGPLAASGTGSTHPAPPVGPLAAAHDRHDLLLVAAYASDDLEGAARTAATELVAGCSACAELAADLGTLATATAALPTPARPRDFRLTPADAERLRSRGVRRFLAALAAPGAFTRPLATGLTTLGVAGLLLASLPGIVPLGMSGGAAPAPDAAVERSVGPEDRTDIQTTDTFAPAASSDAAFAPPEDTSGGTPTAAPVAAPEDSASIEPGGPSPLALLSAAFLVIGLGLFALRRLATRVS